MGLRFCVHPSTGIAHRQHHVPSGGDDGVLRNVFHVEGRVLGLEGEMASFGHRVTRVEREVHDHLFDLERIRFDATQPGFRIVGELDILADETAQHGLDVAEDAVQVDDLGLEDLLSAEGPATGGSARRPVRSPCGFGPPCRREDGLRRSLVAPDPRTP